MAGRGRLLPPGSGGHQLWRSGCRGACVASPQGRSARARSRLPWAETPCAPCSWATLPREEPSTWALARSCSTFSAPRCNSHPDRLNPRGRPGPGLGLLLVPAAWFAFRPPSEVPWCQGPQLHPGPQQGPHLWVEHLAVPCVPGMAPRPPL